MENDIEYSMDEEKNREKAEAVLDKMNNLTNFITSAFRGMPCPIR